MNAKEAIETMIKESQETLDAIRKLIENSEIPEDVKKKAFKELEKTKNKVAKIIPK
jgi:ribosome recycling factor